MRLSECSAKFAPVRNLRKRESLLEECYTTLQNTVVLKADSGTARWYCCISTAWYSSVQLDSLETILFCFFMRKSCAWYFYLCQGCNKLS